MKSGKVINGWTITIFLLLAVIIAGGIIIRVKNSRDRGVEISVASANEMEGQIWVGGVVNNPGLYPFYTDDSIEDIILAAGGLKDGAGLDSVELTIKLDNEEEKHQKVNVNTAEAWLLKALPGVGETRAQAVIDYRRQHGPFRDIYELEKVPGIGDEVFKDIAEMITVND